MLLKTTNASYVVYFHVDAKTCCYSSTVFMMKKIFCVLVLLVVLSSILWFYSNDISRKVCQQKEDYTLVDPIRYQRDLSRIQRTCTKYLGSVIPWTPFSTNKKEDKWNYYVDKERKIGWCLNPKAASSTMKMVLLHASNKYSKNDRVRLSNPANLPRLHSSIVTKFEFMKSLKNSNESVLMKVKKLNHQIMKESLFSFSFVRHPFTRLVSTFEDKILGLSENGERWKWGINGTQGFPKFINRILSEWRLKKTANEHWRPYYINCDYCDIKYDFIGRLESFESDFMFVSKVASINLNSLPPNALHHHPSGSDERYAIPKKKSKEEKDARVKNYFSLLNEMQLKELYEMYKVDFEMFGYKVEPYVSSSKIGIDNDILKSGQKKFG